MYGSVQALDRCPVRPLCTWPYMGLAKFHQYMLHVKIMIKVLYELPFWRGWRSSSMAAKVCRMASTLKLRLTQRAHQLRWNGMTMIAKASYESIRGPQSVAQCNMKMPGHWTEVLTPLLQNCSSIDDKNMDESTCKAPQRHDVSTREAEGVRPATATGC